MANEEFAKWKKLQDENDNRMASQGAGKVAVGFAQDVKHGVLSQYNWSELIGSVPFCMSLMGSCYAAASSPNAAGLLLSEVAPKDGFKRIQHPQLKACLIQMSDMGRFAFVEAEKKMDLIDSKCREIGDHLTNIGGYLGPLPSQAAFMSLENRLAILKEGADNCGRYAQDIEGKFQAWIELACEIHQAIVAKEQRTTLDQRSTNIKIGNVSIEEVLTGQSSKVAEETAKTMKENIDKVQKLFTKAADNVPSSLLIIGIQLVASLGQAVTAIVGQGTTRIISNISEGDKKQANGLHTGASHKKTVGQANINIADFIDPAYQVAIQINDVATLLCALVGIGRSTGINWEQLNPTVVNGKKQSELAFIETTFNFIKNETIWTTGAASVELQQALSALLKVIADLKLEAAKVSLTVQPGSEAVKAWQKQVADGKATITRLTAIASSMPGSAPGSVPMLDGKSAQATGTQDSPAVNAALQSAQEKLRITEAAYTSAQTNYQKAVDSRAKVQADLGSIKSNLGNVSLQQASLEEIKKILVQCIGTLVQIKAQITNLVNFFRALSAMAQHVIKENAKDLMGQVNMAGAIMIGNISLLDVQRTNLYTTILTMQGYFSVFREITLMYTEISVRWFMPGFRLCDEMSKVVDNPGAVNAALNRLNDFTYGAQQAIQDKTSQAQRKLEDGLERKVQGIATSTRTLPASPPAVQAAIEDGRKIITDAVVAGLEANTNGSIAGHAGLSG